jgi:hypothetical protein
LPTQTFWQNVAYHAKPFQIFNLNPPQKIMPNQLTLQRLLTSVFYLTLLFASGQSFFSLRAEEKTPDVFVGGKFQPRNKIDELLLKSLKEKNMEPSPLCSDEVFVRRVYLDVIGTLPTKEEAASFLAENNENKRADLIERLLKRREFADYWALKWADVLRVKAEFPINLWPNGAMNYYQWIHQAIRENRPYDQFARELLTASGSNFRDGASNFYRAVTNKDAETIAESVSQTFLGTQLNPQPENKQKEFAVFFSRVAYKETAQWKEEIVYWTHKPLDSPQVTFPDGTQTTISGEQDPRVVFADWLTSPDNKQFQRTIVNRVWYWLFGRGFVLDPNDFHGDSSVIHIELLDELCKEFVKSRYDLRSLYRLILNSATYQQSSVLSDISSEKNDPFASYPIRRLDAEVLQDALTQIFNAPPKYQSEVPEPYTNIPSYYRTIMLPDNSVSSSFLEMFGRATRDTGLESDRNNDVTESQQLFLLNSTEINNWTSRYAADYKIYNAKGNRPREIMEEVWLTILSRYPTSAELNVIKSELQKPNVKFQDIIWALVNSKEFLCRH